VQLRSYLEALLSDVEKEWGQADPAALPQGTSSAPSQRSGRDGSPAASFEANTVSESSKDADEVVQVVAVRE
jgi:hypothetical protein